ncbi:MAG: sugar phosphate isomerase/epimerase [Planctomycetia bacterium]|nr:sugar phosphate isomerase/epimerase [Planctomycetia bacterium]
MFVAASSRCFPELPLDRCLDKLADLEYTATEIVLGNRTNDLHPEWIAADPDLMTRLCLSNRSIVPCSLFLDIEPDDPYFQQKFNLCSQLAKRIKVALIIVRSAQLGTPYNEEVERLSRLTRIGVENGLLVAVLTEAGRFTEMPESICSMCRSLTNLKIALDPSWFIFGKKKAVEFDSVMPYVSHIRLRDTTTSAFQVQIGQGVQEYGKLVVQLHKVHYNKALCVDLAPLPDLNQESEMRKMRLLLESIL